MGYESFDCILFLSIRSCIEDDSEGYYFRTLEGGKSCRQLADMPAHSPPLLLVLDYLDNHNLASEDEEEMLSLQHCDRLLAPSILLSNVRGTSHPLSGTAKPIVHCGTAC